MALDWAKRIKQYRVAHGLKQAVLAEMLNVDATTVSRWERGRDQPNLSVQKRLKELVEKDLTTVGRGLSDLIDMTGDIAVLLDKDYRLIRASRAHQKLLNYDAAAMLGKQFPFWTDNMFQILGHAGGPKGWWDNNIYRMEFMSIRKAGERANNQDDIVSQVRTVTVRDSSGEVFRYALTKRVAASAFTLAPPKLWTFDEAV